jgi:hypothetical protein
MYILISKNGSTYLMGHQAKISTCKLARHAKIGSSSPPDATGLS